MDRKLLEKYFSDRCSEKELNEVLTWFQTKEGQTYLEQQMDDQFPQVMNNGDSSLYPKIQSEKIFSRIQRHKQPRVRKGRRFVGRVASILLVVAVLSSLLYWSGFIFELETDSTRPAFTTYATDPGQQNIFTLSDGTVIRLNEESSLTVRNIMQDRKRTVILEGEAYFEVAKDLEHPFVVHVNGSTVKVLGTKFNVKADAVAGNVQVAVVEGTVSLKKEGSPDAASALLIRNNFGLLQLATNRITIEKTHAENYLSWATNRLVYSGETLAQVSRQLERLYNVDIAFAADQLKRLKLTANFEKNNLETTVATIASTFDIHYTINDGNVVWMI